RSTPSVPAEPPQEQSEQLAHVQSVRLRPARPTVHFDARRLHYHVLHAPRNQPPVQPKAIPARLVTAPHARLHAQSEARFREADPSRARASHRRRWFAAVRVARGRRKPERPLTASQLKRKLHCGTRCNRLAQTGRCSHRLLLALCPSSTLVGAY